MLFLQSLKRANAMPSSQLAELNKRAFKKPRTTSWDKPHFDFSEDSDHEAVECEYSDDEESVGPTPSPAESEPEDSRCVECGSSSCGGDCVETKAPGRESNGRGQRSRFFMVTDFVGPASKWTKNDQISFVTGQFEIAPETKREHLQLYVEVPTAISFKTFKKRFGGHLHVESRKGTQEQAIAYCTKEETRKPDSVPFQAGEKASGSGKSSEQARAIQAVKDGKSLQVVARDFPGAWVRSYKGLTSLADALTEDRKDQVPIKALCLWGPPGGGKTWKAIEIAKELVASGVYKNGYLLRQPQGVWFDGLKGQDILIFNDFAGDESEMGFTTLLGLFDPFASRVPIKGGFTNMTAKFLIFTSNKHPQDWYEKCTYNKGQLARRFGDGVDRYTGVEFMDTRQDMLKFRSDLGTVDWSACSAKWSFKQ